MCWLTADSVTNSRQGVLAIVFFGCAAAGGDEILGRRITVDENEDKNLE